MNSAPASAVSSPVLSGGSRASALPFGEDVRRELGARSASAASLRPASPSSSVAASGSGDELELRLSLLKAGDSARSIGDQRKSYRISQLLPSSEATGDAVIGQARQLDPIQTKPKSKKYFEQVAGLQAVRDKYTSNVLPLLQAKTKVVKFDNYDREYDMRQ